ncbi:hypothetical protein Zmor_022079 [Zophobas morio]|uniref:DAGKc domain-containing protein n=1 Tax=Zophobas morio TaxID=2755281 RepID=A0AA38HJD1_9CUCU|nr:hypothetical protein Zmor_022079 [Zophobas morio]
MIKREDENYSVHLTYLFEAVKQKRPRSLLVIVNPYGGKKAALRIWRKHVAPIFSLARIFFEVCGKNILTYNCLLVLFSSHPVTEYSGHAKDIVYKSNLKNYDGLVCIGGDGTFNEVLDAVISVDSDICLSPLPGGSTNCLAYTTCGVATPVTSALHIVLGNHRPLDCAQVFNQGALVKHVVTMMSYGFLGDVMRTSEKYRWMGPSRYDYAGFQRVMTPEFYYGRISFKRAVPLNDSETDREGWTHVEGEHLCVNIAVCRCQCAKCPGGMAPQNKLDDGIADLILVGKCSRTAYIHHLLKLSDINEDHFNFKFVKHERITELKYNALGDTSSCWNIDGELLFTSNLHLIMKKKLIEIFAPPYIQ